MCFVEKKAAIVKRAIRAYKWAPGGQSEYSPEAREIVAGWSGNKGEVLFYEIGKTTTSPSGPGIMVYRQRPEWIGHGWLEVRIPKGAKVRKGDNDGAPIICASKVFVVGRVPPGRNR